MGRSFGSRIASLLEPEKPDETIPENEAVTGAEPHYSEGDPDKGIPGFPHPLPGGHAYPVNPAVTRQKVDVPPASPYYGAGMAHGVKSPVKHDGRISPRDAERRYLEKDSAAPAHEGKHIVEAIPVYLTEPAAGVHPLVQASFRQVPVTPGADPVPVAERNPSRTNLFLLNETGLPTAVVTAPAVPASGVNVQNPFGTAAQVVISGGTVTAVSVNGVQVGSGDGTYFVPGYGTISVTYSAPPTWVWSTLSVSGGVRLLNAPNTQRGALLPAGMSSYRDIRTQDQVWAVTDASAIIPQLLSVIEVYKIAR